MAFGPRNWRRHAAPLLAFCLPFLRLKAISIAFFSLGRWHGGFV
jgi:hypothetical protein